MSSPTGRLQHWFSPKRVILVLLLVSAVLALLYAGRMLIASMHSEQRITLDDDHLSLSLNVPDGMGITSVTREGFGDEPQCATVRYRLGTELTLESFASSCEVTDDESSDYDALRNGHHGEYRTMDDVTDPIDVTSVDTPLGPAHVFSQKYGEYTNLSRTWEEPVAIIELSGPTDPEFSSLVIRSDREAMSRDDIVEILDSLRDVRQ